MKGKGEMPDLEKALKINRRCSMKDASLLLAVSVEDASREFRDLMFKLCRRQVWAGLSQALEQHPGVAFVHFDFDKPFLAGAIQPSDGPDGLGLFALEHERFNATMASVWEAVGISDAAKTSVAQGFRGLGKGPGEWSAYTLAREDVLLIAQKMLENPYCFLEDPSFMASLQQERLDGALEKVSSSPKKPRM